MTAQFDLFAPEPPVPAVPGLALHRDFIDAAEEARLAGLVDAAPLAPFRFQGWEARRLTASYGSSYDYQRGRVMPAPPLPDWLAALARRAEPRLGLAPGSFTQALLLRYDPGAGIGWHRDRPQYGLVAGLSLSAPVTLRLRCRTENGFRRAALALPPRSLYVLDGPAREIWEHSILAVEETRRSITFRTMRGGTA